jgi:hypothetical protein
VTNTSLPQTPPTAHDSDGMPPGHDMELWGQTKLFEFSGKFFALPPEHPEITMRRAVKIIFAGDKTIVAADLQHKNLYVVDRSTWISEGCKMHVKMLDMPQTTAVPMSTPRSA